ncbi:MAG: hypothetical protein JSR92_16255 [Proteobacteria bacterium]|nr:hypothetical protein [Pseudomonadota bacterium]
MSTSFSPSQIERLKYAAKTLARTKGLGHSEALDCIAVENGYTNWSILMKHRLPSEHAVGGSMHVVVAGSNDGRSSRFESIVRDVLEGCIADGGQPFNFADVEWVAAEAKALGLLSSRKDVDLLVNVIVKSTAVSESICREEIEPVLTYRPALDTSSSRALERLVEKQGLTAAARSVGISRKTLEKLITGGSRGPLFRHEGVSRNTVDRVRTYLSESSTPRVNDAS